MADNHNPWASQTGNSTHHEETSYLPPSGPPPSGLNQHPPHSTPQYAPPYNNQQTQGTTTTSSSNPYTQTQTQTPSADLSATLSSAPPGELHAQPGYQTQGPPVQGGFSGGYGEPIPPPRRAGTVSESALPQEADRSHQVEVMQSYEMSREWTEDEQNQAILQREFPNIDSSLIAAIYGDSGSLSATREMLQELNTEA